MYQDSGHNVFDVRGRSLVTAAGAWRESWEHSGGKGMLDNIQVGTSTEKEIL